jgi:hypothetical protein
VPPEISPQPRTCCRSRDAKLTNQSIHPILLSYTFDQKYNCNIQQPLPQARNFLAKVPLADSTLPSDRGYRPRPARAPNEIGCTRPVVARLILAARFRGILAGINPQRDIVGPDVDGSGNIQWHSADLIRLGNSTPGKIGVANSVDQFRFSTISHETSS